MYTFKRKKITVESLRYMGRQTVKPYKTILVGSCDEDRSVATEVDGIEYLHTPNDDLGNKHQAGIEFARQFEPDAILIIGSDCWLTFNWIEILFPYLEKYDWCGLSRLYCVNQGELDVRNFYWEGIRRDEPMGGVRFISRRVLDRLNWKLYPSGSPPEVWFDYEVCKKLGKNCYVYRGDNAKCLHISGNWTCIEPWDDYTGCPKIENPEKWLLDNFPHFLEMKGEL